MGINYLSSFLRIFGLFLLAIILLFPFSGFAAGLVTCGLMSQTTLCTICDLFTLAQNLLNSSLQYFAVPVAALMLGYGGFLMVVGGFQGNPQGHSQGMKVLTNTGIGIVIMFTSWLMIDTLLKAIGAYQYADSSSFGPWNEIKCTAPAIPIPTPFPPSTPPAQQQTHNVCAGDTCLAAPGPGPNECDKVGEKDSKCTAPPPPTECTADALSKKYGTSPVNKEAPELQAMQRCISAKLASWGISGGSQYTFDESYPLCNQTRGNTGDKCTPKCSHTIFSCHYGGKTGSTGSFAVDYGNEKASKDIFNAASACGAKFWQLESTHVHVSVYPCDSN